MFLVLREKRNIDTCIYCWSPPIDCSLLQFNPMCYTIAYCSLPGLLPSVPVIVWVNLGLNCGLLLCSVLYPAAVCHPHQSISVRYPLHSRSTAAHSGLLAAQSRLLLRLEDLVVVVEEYVHDVVLLNAVDGYVVRLFGGRPK